MTSEPTGSGGLGISTVIVPFWVFVNVHLTFSPACTLKVAVSVARLPLESPPSSQLMSVKSQPAGMFKRKPRVAGRSNFSATFVS